MSVFLDDGDVRLYHGDALEVLRTLPSSSVDMVATSPPFYGLRDYGTGTWEGGDEGCDHQSGRMNHDHAGDVGPRNEDGNAFRNSSRYVNQGDPTPNECRCGARRVDRQIGLEDTPDQWVDHLVQVFRECRRVLADHGTLWVEIGDSYSASPAGNVAGVGATSGLHGANDASGKYRETLTAGHATKRDTSKLAGIKQKDLLGQPWMLAKALRDPYYTGTIKAEADRVWLAAMIDAEGCIAIHKRHAGTPNYAPYTRKDGTTANYERKNDSFQPKLEISNTSQAIMDRVVAIAGGNCDTRQEAGTQGRKQTLYRWTLTADKCRDLLREVYPHLVGKQHEARLAIGCPSSGEKATEAHEALKLLHGGSTTGIDFPAPESLWEAGWYLRSEIIWSRLRPNPMPESVTDRPTKSHSTVFLSSKRPRYFYDADAIRERMAPVSAARYRYSFGGAKAEALAEADGNGIGVRTRPIGDREPDPAGANARSVWHIPTEPTPFAHFATWPQKLVGRMIQAGTSEHGRCSECGKPWVRETEIDPAYAAGVAYANERRRMGAKASDGGEYVNANAGNLGPGAPRTKTNITLGWSPSCACDTTPVPCTVLDPFAGSGTTLLVARNHQRHSIGIELNADYCQIAAQRLQQLSLLT